jgi:hypothetical protein
MRSVSPPRRRIRTGAALLSALLALAGSAAAQAPGPGAADRSAESPDPADSWAALYAEVRPLLQVEITERDVTDPADLYKFLFQGVMGPAHAIDDEKEALAWLREEWAQLPPLAELRLQAARGAPLPPILEPLRADGQLVRVNLVPLWLAVTEGVPPAEWENVTALAQERLAHAFAKTAQGWLAELGVLRALWGRVQIDTRLWQGAFSAENMQQFSVEIERAGWPAVHHTDLYVARWNPHYRVTAPALLPPSWREFAGPGEAPEETPEAAPFKAIEKATEENRP